MKTRRWSRSVVVAFLLLLPAVARPERPKLTPALVEAGRGIYEDRCAGCHGPRGRGDGPSAQGLDTAPRDLVMDELRLGRDVADVFATVTAGIAGAQMPAFSDVPERERWGLCYRVLILRAAGRRARAAQDAVRPKA